MVDHRDAFRSQYQAALEMLKQTIAKCPEAEWDNPKDKMKFWHIAYHALFYTHLYLQDAEKDFIPWSKHRKGNNRFELPPGQDDGRTEIREPYTKEEELEYLLICQQVVDEKTRKLKLDGESGFDWLPFSKLELQIYNIRHLQQHTGELMERLGTRENMEVDWVGMKHD